MTVAKTPKYDKAVYRVVTPKGRKSANIGAVPKMKNPAAGKATKRTAAPVKLRKGTKRKKAY